MMKSITGFEFTIKGKTYETRKVNITRYGRVITSLSELEELSGTSLEKLAESSQAKQLKATGILMEKLPVLFWDFIKNEDKNSIGDYEDFCDELEAEVAFKFFSWLFEQKKQVNEAQDFLLEAPTNQD